MDSIYFVDRDGVHEIAGMPPGNGQAMVPHLVTFMGVTAGAGRVYRPSDEALKESRENARYMRADAAVMECVELRQRAVALLDWRIEVEDQSPQYQQTRDLLTKICRRIPRFTQYRETLLQAIWFGRYAVENVFAWDWIDGQKLVSVCGWCPVHGDKLVWKLDARTGRFQEEPVGIRVSSVGITTPHVQAWFEANRRYIEPTDWGMAYFPPPEKRDLLVIHRHQIEDGEYEEPRNAGRIFGVGIRSKIYWVWYQKQQALRWLMEFLERSAFGIELWYYPAGNLEAREETFRSATQRVGTGKNVLLVPRPPGGEGMLYGVERIEPSMSGAQVLKEILAEYFGHQIKRYILGQTLTTEAQATGLGSNLASIHLDTFLQIVRYDAGNLQETLTEQLLWRLIHWNWPGLDYRLFRFCIETDRPDVGQRLEALQRAFQMGLKIRTADLRELLGIDGPAEGEEYVQDPNFRQPAPGQPPGLPNLPGPPLDTPEQFRERYALPQGLPKNPQVGQTATIGGATYQFNENRRWQRLFETRPATQQGAGSGQSKPDIPLPQVTFEPASPEDFVKVRDKLPGELRAFLTPYTAEQIHAKIAQGAKVYLSEDKTTGYLLVPLANQPGQYELCNLFNAGGPPRAGVAAAIQAIAQGASQLDCIGRRLLELYSRLGFEVYGAFAWDDQYAPPNWNYDKYDRPLIYLMRYVGQTRDKQEIERRYLTRYYGTVVVRETKRPKR